MSSLIRRWTLFPLLGFLLLARPPVSEANPFETYGFGSRAISMGGAYSAVADDFSAVHYNPAGLPQIGQVNLGVGINFFSANFNENQNVVLGETPDKKPVIGSIDVDNSDNGGFTGGLAVGITRRLALGVGMYLPSDDYLAKLESQNQREPNYIFYEKRPRRLDLLVSVGAEVLRGFYIGVGADILFGPLGKVKVTVPMGGEGSVDLSLMFRPRIAPYGGFLCKIRKDMSVGFVYREEKNQGEVDIEIGAEIDINQLVIPIAGKMDTMIFYSPRQATLGWAWKAGQRFLVDLDLTWLQWSKFEDATMHMVVKLAPNQINVPFQKLMDPGFHDTFLPRVGIEYLLKTWSWFPIADAIDLKLRGGYYFADSPVPEQKGITNYLDSDSHVLSAGLGLALLSLFGTDRALKLDLYFQFHDLVDREHKKDMEMVDLDGDGIPETRVIGYPGYVTGGHIMAGGFTVGVGF